VRLVVIPAGGLGRYQPIVLDAAQFVVELPDGTPIAVGAEYGPDGAVAFSQAKDPDFNRVAASLGVRSLTVCERLELPKPPPGARLVACPG
jgi:hypothetical protein